MDSTVLNFLKEILGAEGARSLMKAAEREPAIGYIVAPRAALAWIGSKNFFEGSVPGIENSYLKFQKSEETYSGIVTLPEANYQFEGVSAAHLASAIAWASGISNSETVEIGDKTLAKLGKAVDALVEARYLAKKVLDPNEGFTFKHEHKDGVHKITAHTDKGEVAGMAQYQQTPEGLHVAHVLVDDPHQRKGLGPAMNEHAEKVTGLKVRPSLGKIELPGQTAKPKKQIGPIGPVQPTKQRSNNLPRIPVVKVEKAEADHECPDCGLFNFQDHKFVGCMCHRDLAKSVKTTVYSDGYVLEFRSGADRDEVAVLRRQLHRD